MTEVAPPRELRLRHHEHCAVFTAPTGLKITVIAEGGSGSGKSVTLGAITDLLTSLPEGFFL